MWVYIQKAGVQSLHIILNLLAKSEAFITNLQIHKPVPQGYKHTRSHIRAARAARNQVCLKNTKSGTRSWARRDTWHQPIVTFYSEKTLFISAFRKDQAYLAFVSFVQSSKLFSSVFLCHVYLHTANIVDVRFALLANICIIKKDKVRN